VLAALEVVAMEAAQVLLVPEALAAAALEVVTSTLVMLEEVKELPASIAGWPPHAWRLTPF
jgi:hypothetical protein